jgi:hypothetical protein
VAAVVLASTALAHALASDASEPLLEATHLPALLTDPSRSVELAYDVYCATSESEADRACDATGTVHVRAGASGPFRTIALRRDTDAGGLRLVAQVPYELATSRTGFGYFAVVESAGSGLSVTVPAGGAEAPHQSVALARTDALELGRHVFGRGRAADDRVAEAPWGSGPGHAGLEQGRNLAPMGGSSFDVDADGVVSLLDEANRRMLRWRSGAEMPEHVRLALRGTLADLSVGDDGTIYVLETAADGDRAQQLRTFGADGAARGVVDLAEHGSAVRMGPAGPVVLQQPAGQWMPATVNGRDVAPAQQARAGRAGRPHPGGSEVVVLREGENEVRAALLGASGTRRTWRVRSDTPLAEVQLADPYRDGLVLVVRTYTDDAAEFVVLVLDRKGLARHFSLDANDWAETAPVSRFRLVGASLYQLGSTPAGLFVDRFDLEEE